MAPQGGVLPDETHLENLRRKYLEERDKRRDPVRDTSLELSGDLARYREDPYTPAVAREPLTDEVDVVIVGAGLGGLLGAAKLRDLGLKRIRLIDMAGDVGGVWYWNRYPGAMCDIESYIYMPLLEEVGYIPTDKYARADEILGHCQSIAKHYDLYTDGLFHTAVTGATWDEAADRWRITTDRGDHIRAQYIVLTLGTLSKPRFPAIRGIHNFRGTMFHTSRWNYEFTGGDANGNLTKLADKEVAVVGTGATAVQCVPQVGRYAKHLYVVQRTPSSVSPRDNRPTEEEFAQSLEPGWQMRRIENFSKIVEGGYDEFDLVSDGWTQSFRAVFFAPEFADIPEEEIGRMRELADAATMERIRERVDATVKDRATAEALKPYYAYLCKRPCFHDDYLDAFNRPNVTLLDTQGRGIERIEPDGIVVNGTFYRLDALIFATGFELGDNSAQKIGFPVVGRSGISLSDKWKAGISTFHGMLTHGFPNLFIYPALNSQSSGAVNWVHLLYNVATQVAHLVEQVSRRGHVVFDVTEAAEREWVQAIIDRRVDNLGFLESCTPGRVNNEGRPADRYPENSNFGGGFLEFLDITTRWRDGNLRGVETR